MQRIIGADLALLHGSITDAGGEIIFTYTSEEGMGSTLESLRTRSLNAALALPNNCIVVVDFDRTCGSWGGRKKPTSIVGTLLMLISYGFGIYALERRGASIKYVSPSAVRHCLGLPAQTSKRDVHKAVQHLLPQSLRGTKFHKSKDVRGDCIDAWLLAYTYHCTKEIA